MADATAPVDPVEAAVDKAVQVAEATVSAAIQQALADLGQKVSSLAMVVRDNQKRLDDLSAKGHRKASVECP